MAIHLQSAHQIQHTLSKMTHLPRLHPVSLSLSLCLSLDLDPRSRAARRVKTSWFAPTFLGPARTRTPSSASTPTRSPFRAPTILCAPAPAPTPAPIPLTPSPARWGPFAREGAIPSTTTGACTAPATSRIRASTRSTAARRWADASATRWWTAAVASGPAISLLVTWRVRW